MGLSKKTFLYSIMLAVLMVSLVVGYFAFMLPSLYVDYVKKDNLNSIAAIQEGYMKTKSYKELAVKNPSGTFSVEIPDRGEIIYVAGKFFQMSIEIKDEELKEILDGFRKYGRNPEKWKETEGDYSGEEMMDKWNIIKEKLLADGSKAQEAPVEVKIDTQAAEDIYKEEYGKEYGKIHILSDSLIVYENGISDGNNAYITYLAMGKTEDSLVISILPVMSPEMNDLLPVLTGSLPMIVTLVFFLVLVASGAFSKRIVNPIIRLAGYAEHAKEAGSFRIEPFKSESNDEIGALGKTLNELYEKLQDNLVELEEKNRMLEEENERQEVFLRASSHQLKTPITAALLLVEGMMNEVGKYKNTKEYLPKVKEQLWSMRKIVEDILYLNHCADSLQIEPVSLRELTEEAAAAYRVQAAEKKLSIEIEGMGTVHTDREILKKIIDNLISNAVQYTPEGEKICMSLADNMFRIENYGVLIEEELLPNICKPFVSSDTKQKGKGLGLYVVSYYNRLLGGKLKVENLEKGVLAQLTFPCM
ncbi:MAG: HAMP domain-containing histidine kinase [Lachnospiraceae bacterium]|nr:HAMP domain-containing histidine kinase [Lachnospiraceae bacterium]